MEEGRGVGGGWGGGGMFFASYNVTKQRPLMKLTGLDVCLGSLLINSGLTGTLFLWGFASLLIVCI